MTDQLPETPQNIAPADALPADAPADRAETAAPAPAAVDSPEASGAAAPDQSAPRGGRGRRKPGGERPAAQDAAPGRAPLRTHPVLEQLAGLYPQLFGAHFLPLKRGVFQDLQAAHPDLFDKEALKLALGIHTRSTRYLQSVAAGEKRHDLQGQPVEDMAPEHVHHALMEVFRRRKPRAGEDHRPKLIKRIAQAFEASGLGRDAYAELVRSRDEATNALVDAALAEAAERIAKAEALLRAFEASGSTVEQFADMYGMDPRAVVRTLESVRARAAAAAARAEQAAQAPQAPEPAAE